MAALRRSIVAPDVEIAFDLAGHGAVNDTIVDKERQSHYALIIKTPWHSLRSRREPDDWELIQRCPVPLLLTAGRPWHPKARFLAAMDVVNPGSVGERTAVLETANAMRLACAAELDLVHIPSPHAHEPAQCAAAARLQLEKLAQQYDLDASCLHQLTGRTAELLRQFASGREYDLLIVGASKDIRVPWSPEIGLALTQSLPNCDLLLIQDSDNMSPAFSGRRLLRWNPLPLWQWLGTD